MLHFLCSATLFEILLGFSTNSMVTLPPWEWLFSTSSLILSQELLFWILPHKQCVGKHPSPLLDCKPEKYNQVKDWDVFERVLIKERERGFSSFVWKKQKKSSRNRIKEHIENKHSKRAGSPFSLLRAQAKSPTRL